MPQQEITIEYFNRNNYGTEMHYFADRNFATGFQMLTGKKTFDSRDQRALAAILNKVITWCEVVPPKQ